MRATAAIILSVSGALALTACSKPAAPAGGDWMLREESSSYVCHVQLKTASPLGTDLAGPFSSRKAACNEAASRYEDATTDSSKCGSYGKGTVDGCAKDGVTLPPAQAAKLTEAWMVRRDTSNGWCQVQQKTTASTAPDISGPFSSEKAACSDAKDRYDDTGTGGNGDKCTDYQKGTKDRCKAQGVDLPK